MGNRSSRRTAAQATEAYNCDDVVRPKISLRGHFFPTIVRQAPGDPEIPLDYFKFDNAKFLLQTQSCVGDPCWLDQGNVSLNFNDMVQANSDYPEQASDFMYTTDNGGLYTGHIAIKFKFERVQ